jgi:hypothetical protein
MPRLFALLLAALVLMPAVAAPPEPPKLDPADSPKKDEASAYRSRSGAIKAKLLKLHGGNAESEQAVALGLAWLARQQKADGSWVYDQGDKGQATAATGMVLLAFLGAGETHTGKGKYQKNVEAGVKWLVKNMQAEGPNKGKFTDIGSMYSQAIGAIALCEAYGMTKDKDLLKPAQAAIDFIQKAQGNNGSWGYTAGQTGDTSIVGWQIQALQAAIISKDIVVDQRVIKKAIDFLNLAGGGARKAAYGYNDNAGASPGTALTAVGLLSRYYIDMWVPEHAGMAEGVQGLMKHKPAKAAAMPDMYFYYYATQVVHFFAGDEWKEWNEGPKGADGKRSGGMRDWLVSLQINKDGANMGSWDAEGGYIGRSCGRVGTTALCVLTLEVYYRHMSGNVDGKAADALKILEKDK